MDQVQQHIDRIRHKIQQRNRELSQLRKDNARLLEAASAARAHQAVLEEEIRNLKEQNNILKAATANMNQADKAVFERSINRYIKDIDKCIALLSQ